MSTPARGSAPEAAAAAPREAPEPPHSRRRLGRDVLLILLACAVVYWPRLGAGGFTDTEGHRVIPAWHMLESGEYLLPRLFGRIYLTKPQGIHWAIAGSSAVFGRTEFGARAASALAATVLALVAYAFARRWFGPRRAILAGLSQALLPLMWSPGRSAEIEALHTLAVVSAMLLVLDLALRNETARRGGAAASSLLLGAAIAAAGLLKGPVFVVFVLGALGGAAVAARSGRPLARPTLWGGMLIGAAALAGVGWLTHRALATTGEEAITQNLGHFLWGHRPMTLGYVLEVALLPLAVFASGLPAAAALFCVSWRGHERPDVHAAAVGAACVLPALLLALLGVDNPRYGTPAAALASVLVPYAVGHLGRRQRRSPAAPFQPYIPQIGVVLLIAGAAVWIFTLEPRHRARSGRSAGITLAQILPDSAIVGADHLIAARPEVFLYAHEAASRNGRDLAVRWSLGGPATHLVLRTDSDSGEAEAERRAGALAGADPIGDGSVHEYTFRVYRLP